MVHATFKLALLVFCLIYFIALGTFAAGRLNWVQPEFMDYSRAVMDVMGQPWASWLEEQTDQFGAPFINILILGIFTYLTEKRRNHR